MLQRLAAYQRMPIDRVESQASRCIALRIHINDQSLFAGRTQSRSYVNRRRGFTNAAFLIRDA